MTPPMVTTATERREGRLHNQLISKTRHLLSSDLLEDSSFITENVKKNHEPDFFLTCIQIHHLSIEIHSLRAQHDILSRDLTLAMKHRIESDRR